MTDKQIKLYQRLSQFAGLAMLLFGAVAAFDWLGAVVVFGKVSVTQIFTGLGVLAGVLSRWASQQLPSAKELKPPPTPVGPLAVFLLALGLMFSAGCPKGPVYYATVTVRGLQQARDLTASQVATYLRSEHARCKAAHGAKTKAFADCVKPALEVQDKWRQLVRPVIDTSAQSGLAALQTNSIVEKCKAEKNCLKVIFAIIKPGGCALMRGLRAFGHLLADKGASILGALKPWEGVVCE